MSAKDFLFFDPDKAAGPDKASRPGAAPDPGRDVTGEFAGSAPLTVSSLLTRVKAALAGGLPARLAVVGELSNVKIHASGHIYFRLKDQSCAIDACMFRQSASRLKFRPVDGLEVLVEGRADVYEARGQLQLYAQSMTPRGAGALELAFRQLRERLSAEGLFDPAHKRPIPRFPRAIGLVTSATGAAVRDVCRTLKRRWPSIRICLLPSLVQGDSAAASVARAVSLLDANAERLGIDTIIVARGGGSLEDLWPFNNEQLARAIFASRTPIISGVGHEVDVTICDLVADLRAPTPTGAAELAVPQHEDVARHVSALESRIQRSAQAELSRCQAALSAVQRSAALRDPLGRVRGYQQRLDELSHRLYLAIRHRRGGAAGALEPLAGKLASLHPARLAERAAGRLDRLAGRLAWVLGGRSKRAGDQLAALENRLQGLHPAHRLRLAQQQLSAAARQLESMSYRSVLGRGFSVTRTADGTILRSVSGVSAGQVLLTELGDGKVRSVVDGDKARPRPRPAADEGQKSLFGDS